MVQEAQQDEGQADWVYGGDFILVDVHAVPDITLEAVLQCATLFTGFFKMGKTAACLLVGWSEDQCAAFASGCGSMAFKTQSLWNEGRRRRAAAALVP
jgi:hypothetical protein